MPPFVPPIKCQGIKTKLVSPIRSLVRQPIKGRWIEPFCGSCVVAFNLQPENALLSDTNQHIIRFYQAVQAGNINSASTKEFLYAEGRKLKEDGEYYYEVRARFNRSHEPLDFLFLNRACFNGVIRFNQKGNFNVPFCRKPERFSPAYITKIANQLGNAAKIMHGKNWTFQVSDFEDCLSTASETDFVYADPPYAGRIADYFTKWNDQSEGRLTVLLKELPCPFVLSTWQQNQFRQNPSVQKYWLNQTFEILSLEHFYHVGASESLRHAMTEALISNFTGTHDVTQFDNSKTSPQLPLFV